MAKVHVTEITATERGQVVTLSNGDTLEMIETALTKSAVSMQGVFTEFTITGILVS